MLASLSGGPNVAEARRRLAAGLPLVVGLSRADTEDLQGRLVDLGLLPRIGPAPEGTTPLGSTPASALLPKGRTLVLAGLALLGAAAWLVVGPGPRVPEAEPTATPARRATVAAEPEPTPAPEPVPREIRMELGARLQPAADGGLLLVGVAQVKTFEEPPNEPLVLTGRVGGRDVVSASFPASATPSFAQRVGERTVHTKNLLFQVAVAPELVAGAREIVLEAAWGRWRSEPTRVPVPRSPGR